MKQQGLCVIPLFESGISESQGLGDLNFAEHEFLDRWLAIKCIADSLLSMSIVEQKHVEGRLQVPLYRVTPSKG